MIEVLHIDDEPGFLDITQRFLHNLGGYNVTSVTDPDIALELLEHKHFDAVISDYQMPGMTGIDLLKIVRHKGSDIPFLLFTGKSREEVVIDALNFGADFYIRKGADVKAQFAELESKLRQALDLRQARIDLGERRRLYEWVFERASNPIMILNTKHTIVASNPAMVALAKMNRAEIVGKKCYHICHNADAPPPDCPMEALLKSQQPETAEMVVEAAGARYLVSCTPDFGPDRALRAVIHIATKLPGE